MKQRAQLTFSSWNKVKAFGKPDATHLAQVHHSFVCARPEPLDDDVDVGPVFSKASDDVQLAIFLQFRSKDYQYQNLDFKN